MRLLSSRRPCGLGCGLDAAGLLGWSAREQAQALYTPGHQIVRIQSGGEIACYVGDMIHQTQQVARASWSPFFDWAAASAAAVRASVLERIAHEGAALLSPHLPFPGMGQVEAGGEALQFVPRAFCPPCG